MTLQSQKMMDGPIWMDEGTAVFVVSSVLTSGRTCGLVKFGQKHRSLELEVQVFSHFRPNFPKLVSSHHLAALTFANLGDPF